MPESLGFSPFEVLHEGKNKKNRAEQMDKLLAKAAEARVVLGTNIYEAYPRIMEKLKMPESLWMPLKESIYKAESPADMRKIFKDYLSNTPDLNLEPLIEVTKLLIKRNESPVEEEVDLGPEFESEAQKPSEKGGEKVQLEEKEKRAEQVSLLLTKAEQAGAALNFNIYEAYPRIMEKLKIPESFWKPLTAFLHNAGSAADMKEIFEDYLLSNPELDIAPLTEVAELLIEQNKNHFKAQVVEPENAAKKPKEEEKYDVENGNKPFTIEAPKLTRDQKIAAYFKVAKETGFTGWKSYFKAVENFRKELGWTRDQISRFKDRLAKIKDFEELKRIITRLLKNNEQVDARKFFVAIGKTEPSSEKIFAPETITVFGSPLVKQETEPRQEDRLKSINDYFVQMDKLGQISWKNYYAAILARQYDFDDLKESGKLLMIAGKIRKLEGDPLKTAIRDLLFKNKTVKLDKFFDIVRQNLGTDNQNKKKPESKKENRDEDHKKRAA